MRLYNERRILTVTQFTALVRGVLEENFEHVWVEGEISNLSQPQSGYLYFTLKDAGAQLRTVMFRTAVRSLKFTPQNGMRVLCRGRVTVYEARGDYQLIIEYIEPQGLGALQLAFIQLKERLAKEGLFSETRKKPIPALPQRIGVVTSPTGAAIRDILTVLSRRFSNVELLIVPVRVQGDGAAQEIATAIDDLNRHGKIDVMIVGRGGGSLEDLWAFNEEVVARAIARSAIPVISAVGHETDFSIADFVADLRAATPSAAAEVVVRSKAALTAEVSSLSHRMMMAMERTLEGHRGRVQSLSRAVQDPSRVLGRLSQRVDDLSERMERQVRHRLGRESSRTESLSCRLEVQNPAMQLKKVQAHVESLTSRAQFAMERRLITARDSLKFAGATLHAVSPLATLSRGYSIARKLPRLEVVRDSRQIAPGDRVELTFAKGSALCSVEESDGAGKP
ncbi:exodeoxyribonuclease VII large subunit [Geomonas sp. RF6]|uniref:exodeoxyribonuclease VII large subunit n=1 Tax=Geomonas sp. RF6 TaxID=2897342 RepID=UPI001E625DCE|nr:exodeoxyribonuclease VII large subunit [Geomonas sp. RF6]UFS70897.1 exodeoxyribonuclease VII large subunit [Geomonas sp. RF6]